MNKISKLLIANRGEIAVRVLRTAKEMGIKTVAIYSEADKNATHVQLADEAWYVGESPVSLSYLHIENIIDICKKSKVDAVHPGYGFLSENAEFARRVIAENLIFIGPSPESIALMGDKLKSKEAVANYDVPLIPGDDLPLTDVRKAISLAKDIGYPVLIKASAGGGGKGMRIVNNAEELEEQIKRAKSEALTAFGDDRVFMEKYIESPKHIEFQIFGDSHGNIEHLFERECSIQRRYQKVIEEAPSPIMTNDLRDKMGKAAVNVAKACHYLGAGTVEFIVDKDRKFYFLEMNTRLQVEHPVTEFITGIDLVKEQIRVAEGKKLSFDKNSLSIRGHAIQARVYAEDPENNFLPQAGTLTTYRTPGGPGVRVDDGYREGMDIPVQYDPMIAKLIVHGSDREQAINRLKRSIEEYKILGISTSLSFCQQVLNHPSFLDGTYTTGFVAQFYSPSLLYNKEEEEEKIAACLAILIQSESDGNSSLNSKPVRVSSSRWKNKRK